MIKKFYQILILAASMSWAGGAAALALDPIRNLGFGGGGNAHPLERANANEGPSPTPFVQSCDGLRFSATDQLCPFSGSYSAALSGRGRQAFDPSDADEFYTPLTQPCDGLRFSGTDQVCAFDANGGLGSGVGFSTDGGLGFSSPWDSTFYTPLTQSCEDLRFSGTDQVCPLTELQAEVGTDPDNTPGGKDGNPGDKEGNPGNREGTNNDGLSTNPNADTPSGEVNAPATLALMGLGLVALRYARRRKHATVIT